MRGNSFFVAPPPPVPLRQRLAPELGEQDCYHSKGNLDPRHVREDPAPRDAPTHSIRMRQVTRAVRVYTSAREDHRTFFGGSVRSRYTDATRVHKPMLPSFHTRPNGRGIME